MKNIRKRKIIILVVLLILIMVSWLIWGNLSVETNKLTVTSKDLPEAFDNFSIAHISDLHNAEYGKNNEKLIDILKEKMNKCAMDFNFEEAAIYRDKIKSLEDMMEKQKIDTSTSDLNQDVIAMARAHDEACVQVFFVRNGKIMEDKS